MTTNNLVNRTSTRVPFQLPEFIRSEESYQTFVAFIQAYYEWMELADTSNSSNSIATTNQGPVYATQNLLKYTDIDNTIDAFVQYFIDDFLPNFPTDALTDKAKLTKVAREIYNKKGTPASYQLLFRALYNSDVELFMTRDVVFRASDGKWYVSKSLRLATDDPAFLGLNNLRIFGETSKSIATVERGLRSGNKIELYISNIERLFQTGETIRVVGNKNETLYFKDGAVVDSTVQGSAPLTAKIVGSVSSVQINPAKRGQLYNAGDPVVFFGGVNEGSQSKARATVLETTTGSLRDVSVDNGSYGYRQNPNTAISIAGGGGSGAIAQVSTIDPSGQVDVGFIPTDSLAKFMNVNLHSTIRLNAAAYTQFGANTSANINCSLANAFSFTGFSTYPIGGVLLQNGGNGYRSLPTISAKSVYDTTDVNGSDGYLASLGILGPIQIINGGDGYANGEIIQFMGGTGEGAYANLTVNATGTIISADYIYANNADGIVTYPLGGIGYRNTALPELVIDTVAGANAVLTVTTVLGDGATFTSVADERGIGAITSFQVEDFGEDYISAPSVSLKVRDLVVTNVSLGNLVRAGDTIYQGNDLQTSVFRAYVDTITLLSDTGQENTSKYLLRTYNYTSNTKTNLQLKSTDRVVGDDVYLDLDTTYNTTDTSGNPLFQSGIRTYGNGAAIATAKFLNGLIIGEGQYLNSDGFPSSFQVLENEDYNDFTYELLSDKSFNAYKDILFKLVHPSGTKIVPTTAIKSEHKIDMTSEMITSNSHTLGYYTGTQGSNAAMTSTFTNTSNNIIKFDALVGANLEQILAPNAYISLVSDTGPNVYSTIVSVDANSNTAVISDNVFLTFANVAFANAVSSNSQINITSLTGTYDVINNGDYSNTQNHLEDIAFVGDKIRIYANASNDYQGTITYVSLSNNVIFTTPSISFSANNANVSIARNLVATHVDIFNTIGTVFLPELATESGDSIITEIGQFIIIG